MVCMKIVSNHYHTIEQMSRDNKALGMHWFCLDTIKFWRTRFHLPIYDGKYFITSEVRRIYGQFQEPRKYTIRSCVNGEVATIGEFQQYETLRNARTALKKFITSNHDGVRKALPRREGSPRKNQTQPAQVDVRRSSAKTEKTGKRNTRRSTVHRNYDPTNGNIRRNRNTK